MAGIGFTYTQRGKNIIDFVADQGKTFVLSYTAPVSLTLVSAKLVVKTLIDDASPTVEMSTTNGRAVISGQTITYTMTAAEMAAVNAPIIGIYENEVVTNLGTLKVLSGRFTINKEIAT